MSKIEIVNNESIMLVRKEKMAPQLEEKILRKLNRIEDLLIKIVPQKTELTEDEVLDIIKEGDREYKEGKTEDLESFLKREYPQYVTKDRAQRKVQKIVR